MSTAYNYYHKRKCWNCTIVVPIIPEQMLLQLKNSVRENDSTLIYDDDNDIPVHDIHKNMVAVQVAIASHLHLSSILVSHSLWGQTTMNMLEMSPRKQIASKPSFIERPKTVLGRLKQWNTLYMCVLLRSNIWRWLISLHSLRASRWIEYKVPVLMYKVLNGSALRYLGPLVAVADLQGQRTLRSAGTNRLVVPSVRLSTISCRAFSVAAPCIWNALREETTSAQSLTSFRQHLKTWLFSQSYPDLIIWSVL